MPNVNGKEFPYTPAGMKKALAAKKALAKSDRGPTNPFIDIDNPKANIARYGKDEVPFKMAGMNAGQINKIAKDKKKLK